MVRAGCFTNCILGSTCESFVCVQITLSHDIIGSSVTVAFLGHTHLLMHRFRRGRGLRPGKNDTLSMVNHKAAKPALARQRNHVLLVGLSWAAFSVIWILSPFN